MVWLELGKGFFFYPWLTGGRRQLHWDSGHTPSDPSLYSGLNNDNNFVQEGALSTEEHAFPGWQHPYSAAPSNPFPDPIDTDHNSYPPEGFLPAFDPAIFDKPYNNGRYLCNVLGCKSTFTRLADRNRHVNSKHNNTPHFCLILGCEKSLERGGKGYTRQDKLQEHMQKKHAVSAEAAV
jgi:hypothetical protein